MIILLYNVVLNVLNKKQKNEVNAKAEFTTLAKRTTSFTSIANITLFAQAIGKLPKENIREIISEEKTNKHCNGYDTWSLFISMMFCQFSGCDSVRDISNVSSCYWVTDVNNLQYAVPNYLTGRQFNVSLSVGF
jgi:hypothetical protein